jgi:hypothetical protein
MSVVYLRFVFAKTQRGSRRRVGILRESRYEGSGSEGSEEMKAVVRRLGLHLPVPPLEAFSGGRGLCWFKLEARQCIDQVREIAFFLEERRGERIWQIYSRNPGLITYEDESQVVAVPDAARGLCGSRPEQRSTGRDVRG